MKRILFLFFTIVPLLSFSTKTYDSYKGLVMAGYQGWFNAPDDGESRGWHHFTGRNGFKPGSCTIDLWPDMSEYIKTYETEFQFEDGTPCRIFSSADASTIDLHFDWMQRYGLDGVFMQRFIAEIREPSGLMHFTNVLDNAMKAAKKYERAIAVMYDLSGMAPEEGELLLNDMDMLNERYSLFDHQECPSYLYHNGKPLVAVWGVGFNDNRKYTTHQCAQIIDALKNKGYSVMIGVPTQWQQLSGDTLEDPELLELVKRCDVVMPWFVGRYNEDTYENYKPLIKDNIRWAKENGVDYAPLCFPGFSWKNMLPVNAPSVQIPRNHGSFFWSQLKNVISEGAEMIYIAMFDEIDEGTAIFKCTKNVPSPSPGSTFVAMEDDLDSDYYLWLAGQASKMLKKEMPFNPDKPVKNIFEVKNSGVLPLDIRKKLDQYNVCFKSISKNGSKSSMPIGNGDITANVWVEENGDIVLYIGKSDAWAESTRLLKAGRIRIKTVPNILKGSKNFKETLDLKNGVIEISSNYNREHLTLSFWVDANNPVVRIHGYANEKIKAYCINESLRPEDFVLNNNSGIDDSFRGVTGSNIPVKESADFKSTEPGFLANYHHNQSSFFPITAISQGAEEIIGKNPDPYIGRIFGTGIWGPDLTIISDSVISSSDPSKDININIGVLTIVNSSPEEWKKKILEIKENDTDYVENYVKHCEWWNNFWNRSWIFLSGDKDAEDLTRAYLLQRYMMACQSRGAYPAKFNGGLFTFDYQGKNGDYRQWGPAYWFQNNRHMYWPLIVSGDYDLLQPWFALFKNNLPIQKAATFSQFGHGGAYFPETMNMFGLFHMDDWGWDNQGNFSDTRWIRYHYSGGLELIAQMLDFYKATENQEFANTYLFPLAKEFIAFFTNHWPVVDEKIRFYPANSIEMYWDCTNPMDYIAGLNYVINGLIKNGKTPEYLIEQCNDLKKILPELPFDKENGVLLPAYEYGKSRNFENPELYAVFPFRIYGLGHPDIDIALKTFERRLYPEATCWHQDPIQAPLLGLTDVGKKALLENARSLDPEVAFPGFWAPRHDYMPDFDNGGALMTGLQYMLLQDIDNQTLLLPSFPKEWDVDFKLNSLNIGPLRIMTKKNKIIKFEFDNQKRNQIKINNNYNTL